MTDKECRDLQGVVKAFIRMVPHSDRDLADLFDLLGQLEPGDKRFFWGWLGDNAPNIKRWLMAKGGSYRRAA